MILRQYRKIIGAPKAQEGCAFTTSVPKGKSNGALGAPLHFSPLAPIGAPLAHRRGAGVGFDL
jgi:hypothetical protein